MPTVAKPQHFSKIRRAGQRIASSDLAQAVLIGGAVWLALIGWLLL
jgi:hypothetical protein